VLTERTKYDTLLSRFKGKEKVLTVFFFKTPSGNEPVRDWLKLRNLEEKKMIGEDIKALEFLWPIGYPQVRKLDKDLWELRTHLQGSICRIFFTVLNEKMVLLHSIIKKSQKTPSQDLALAKKRRDEVFLGGMKHEK
jgi:phage-related protein